MLVLAKNLKIVIDFYSVIIRVRLLNVIFYGVAKKRSYKSTWFIKLVLLLLVDKKVFILGDIFFSFFRLKAHNLKITNQLLFEFRLKNQTKCKQRWNEHPNTELYLIQL
jgi:hypothetical protein